MENTMFESLKSIYAKYKYLTLYKWISAKVLKSRIYESQLQKEQEEAGEYRKLAGSGARSEKIRTYNYPQDRMTDNRISFSTSLNNVISGK